MPAVPGETPVTRPLEGLIVAADVLLLTQLPPDMDWLKSVVPPWHSPAIPVIGVSRYTEIDLDVTQPVGNA